MLGTAKSVHDQQENGLRLMLDSTGQRVVINDKLAWQSVHVIGRLALNRDASNTFGTISENHYDMAMTLVVASKRTDLVEFLMDVFRMVEYIAVDEIAIDTVDVLRRNWLQTLDQAKNYDPALRAVAVRYRIPNVKEITGTIIHEQTL